MNVYDEINDLYGFTEHYNKKATCFYLPTKRSRKKRVAFSCCFSSTQEKYLLSLKKQNKWYAVFVESYGPEICPTCGHTEGQHRKSCEYYGCIGPYF